MKSINMLKEDALIALKEGKTLFVPTWYFTMSDENVYATCGYENCCQWDFDNFDEFWEMHGDDKEMKIVKG